MTSLVSRYRKSCIVAIHLSSVALANYAAFWLRFDGDIPDWEMHLFVQMLPWLLLIRGLTFVPFRLYQGIWRYTSVWDLRNIVLGSVASTAGFYVVVRWMFGMVNYPLSVYVVDTVLLIIGLGGVRLARRLVSEFTHGRGKKRIIVYGAGDSGHRLVRELRDDPASRYDPIGFIDDDRAKTGQRIHGVPVLGTRRELTRIVASLSPNAILIATPSMDAVTIREIVESLEAYKVSIKIVPNWGRTLDGKVEANQIRNLSVEDLLARVPVGLNVAPLRGLIEGKRIMVTGAGGSIGSELCRQIAALNPKTIVLYERYENSLHAIATELAQCESSVQLQAMIGDITDEGRLDKVMQTHQPQILFHAAAHKHVPLMEFSPCEAVKNNIAGTRIVARAAERHQVERFIMISTDKAVNPSSVMGVTKRVAEMIIQEMSGRSRTCFVTVRFGNVLGSNGSVVPMFLQQIKNGGPVTVTHPEMRRYFMLIPEAVQLVLQAMVLAEPGALFVLEMGEQIKIVDLARNLIRLAGYVPGDEIPIRFTGLRPGEKLFEELIGPDEIMESSAVEKISRVRGRAMLAPEELSRRVSTIELMALMGESNGVLRELGGLVPAFRHDGNGGAREAARPRLSEQRVAR
ncbi:MAG: polysaccharide biosynthesis protein [Nitrospira sp.]|nr:MAG: polysaccharide biosynthesis protein [Nitrospira sp.]